jgi:CubicO group peptidase (beta-lactamase class C family)
MSTQPTSGASVHGTGDSAFSEVTRIFADNLDSGEEIGGAIAVDVEGKTVLDIWGGHADAAKSRDWTKDTIVNVWSCSKMVTNLAALVLVDRGLLDVFAPVATYWPEFAQNGKENIEVRHILSHTSGVSGWDAPWSVEDSYDYEKATGQLARQAPWWEPGTVSGYHADNQGHLVGELVRRVSGKRLKEFVRTEIAEPLGADFQIGAARADTARIADVVRPTSMPPSVAARIGSLSPDHPMLKTFAGAPSDAEIANTAAWRSAELGAVNGHGNARSLARVMSAISLAGEVNGVQLLSPQTIELIFQEQTRGEDLVLGIPLRWGIGYGLPEPQSIPFIPDERIAFWGGYGGSMVAMHPERRLTIAYVMNKMASGIIGSERAGQYFEAIYRALT